MNKNNKNQFENTTEEVSYDPEAMLYRVLGKLKKRNELESFHKFSNDAINLFVKRFGGKEYVEQTDGELVVEQLIDVVTHLSFTPQYKWFNEFSLEEREMMITTIYGWMKL